MGVLYLMLLEGLVGRLRNFHRLPRNAYTTIECLAYRVLNQTVNIPTATGRPLVIIPCRSQFDLMPVQQAAIPLQHGEDRAFMLSSLLTFAMLGTAMSVTLATCCSCW